MRGLRVAVIALALMVLPLVAATAQGRGKGKDNRAQNAAVGADCKAQQADALARAQADGHAPYGLDKKCDDPVAPPPPPPPAPPPPPPPPPPLPPPPPPPDQPPSGQNEARGVVFEDVDGNGLQDMFAGEMGLAGWTVQLSWNGQAIAEMQTDADGFYDFVGLGRSSAYVVCLVVQAGYAASPGSGASCRPASVDSPVVTWARNDYAMMLQ